LIADPKEVRKARAARAKERRAQDKEQDKQQDKEG
jgi:putative ubiquitin-RnfH superfamily antitoxin RatB of RatAB toxin-antitoxin module